MSNLPKSLEALGFLTGTDKSRINHAYLDFYDKELKSFQEQSFTMLEIGVYHGNSLKMWASWFPQASIVGIDIDPAAAEVPKLPNNFVHIGDANVSETFEQAMSIYGNPTIVLDDGSHMWEHQLFSLTYLWPKILPGGAFIMEDLHTSFPPLAPTYKSNSPHSTYEFLAQLNYFVVGSRYLDNSVSADAAIAAIWPTVDSIHWFRGTCIIRKKE